MPVPPHPLPRRPVLAALAAALAGAAAGCRESTGSRPAPSSVPTTTAPPDPLLADLTAERQLLGSYQATAGRHPGLAARLAPLRADHAAHVAALERELGIAPPPATSPAPPGTESPPGSPTASPTGQPTDAPDVPGTPSAAVAALRAAERAAARARSAACLTGPADRAALLASIAACEASHEVLLT